MKEDGKCFKDAIPLFCMPFELSLSNVRDFGDFLAKIKGDLNLESSNHTLKIYCLNSELSKEELFDILRYEYPTSVFISDFSHTYIKEEINREEINFYSYKDPNSAVIFVLSIVGKGKIDVVVDRLIKKLPRTYYFWLPLSIFDKVKEEIIDNFNTENIIIDSFIAVRNPNFYSDCNLRPEFGRRMQYEGEDGLDFLREVKGVYGVLPKKISFQINKKFRFSIDQRNTFIIDYGLPYLDRVLEVIQITLSKFAEIEEVLSSIKFEKIHSNGNMDFNVIPLKILFSNKKNVVDMDNFFDKIETDEEGRYCVLNPLLEEGSLFFSATIIDVNKKALFSVCGDENMMNVLPQSNCGKEVISRFYEVVDINLDNHTHITKENG